MWNEGFEQARFPWCKLYTNNKEFVDFVGAPIPFKAQDGNQYAFNVKKYQTVLPDVDSDRTAFIDSQDPDSEFLKEDTAARFLGLVNGHTVDMAERVSARLSQWRGI